MYAYHNLLLAQMNNEISQSNFKNSGNMLKIAKERLQLELRMLNDSIAINETAVQVREVQMDYDLVMQKALENSSFSLDNELSLLNAESNVARAKAARGFSFALNARFGMSQTGPEFPQAYKNMLDQETVGITFSIPIFDWGLGKGKVQKADINRSEPVQQPETAVERYELTMHRFREGNASVTDLNMAQTENDSAFRQWISDVSNSWTFYYSLRQATLYDFINGDILKTRRKKCESSHSICFENRNSYICECNYLEEEQICQR